MKRKLRLPERLPKERFRAAHFRRLAPDVFARIADLVHLSQGPAQLAVFLYALFGDAQLRDAVVTYCAKLAKRFGWSKARVGDPLWKRLSGAQAVMARLQARGVSYCAFCGRNPKNSPWLANLSPRVCDALGVWRELDACVNCWLGRYPERIVAAKQGSRVYSAFYLRVNLHLASDIQRMERAYEAVHALIAPEYDLAGYTDAARWAVKCFLHCIPPETGPEQACERFFDAVLAGLPDNDSPLFREEVRSTVGTWRARLALMKGQQ